MIGNRKVIMFLLVFFMASALCWFGKIEGQWWVAGINVALGIFTAGNVAAKKYPPAECGK